MLLLILKSNLQPSRTGELRKIKRSLKPIEDCLFKTTKLGVIAEVNCSIFCEIAYLSMQF